VLQYVYIPWVIFCLENSPPPPAMHGRNRKRGKVK
jgi:hypothetical protein